MRLLASTILLFLTSAASAQMMQEADPSAASEQRPLTADELKFFESKVRPLLIANCYGCHSTSGGKAKGGLKLDTRDATLKGGNSGPAVVPGDADSSLLVRAVRYHDEDSAMPPAGKLPDADIATLEQWVAMGAPDPRTEALAGAGASPGTTHRWTSEDIARGKETHWSYRPVSAPSAPSVKDPSRVRSPIDAFVLSAMEMRGLSPAPDADRRTLLRRASLDLLGLPPSEAELAAFERDSSPDAFAKAIDRMLASPHFGERWGRHWLDVARYAESSGKESNIVYPHAWRYRDYAIASFNEDKPYDRFLVEQLAGDLLPAASEAEKAELAIATGYLAIGTKSHNGRGKPQFQMDLADEQIDAVTQGMLGLTVACARCHDHKFDPIPQKDYYAVAGIFLSTETRYGTFEAQGNNHPSTLVELPRDSGVPWGPTMTTQQRSLLTAAAERVREEAERSAQVLQQAREARQRGEELPANIQQQVVRARATQGANANLESVTARFDASGEPTERNLVAMGVAERRQALNARLLDRGELDKPGTVVPRGLVRVLSQGDEPAIRKGSGRLQLAEWIASEENPLTARVWANRVWLHLFGKGLVPTPDNFGMSGQQPSHPELLDHLATRLMENGWSTKRLIREIMLSRSYAMSSEFDAKDAEIDPDNTYLWRMPKKRLEAEAIRDSMLRAAGLLDLEPRVGSPVAFTEGGMRGPQQERVFGAMASATDNHRSVYLPILRDRVPESLEVFDFAEPAFVTGQRDATNVPTQALYLLNSAEVTRIADAFARRVMQAGTKESDRVEAAFAAAFGRAPSTSELRACRDFLDDFGKAYAKDAAATRESNPRAGTLRERARQRLQQAAAQRMSQTPAQVTPDVAAYSALCQALLLSAEFRTVD
ncbi:MAG: PSD1 and planctomycete cytochrome C domain-containing protein [Planctomycetaceae bacterium]|nr:PSD1 and planctomycete cytochrome C domain-containing protein [Planctomycetaceae bacterium]